MKNNFLICPRCGHKEGEVNNYSPDSFAVICRNCQQEGPVRATEEEAVSAWKSLDGLYRIKS